jgi:hypothetical protein
MKNRIILLSVLVVALIGLASYVMADSTWTSTINAKSGKIDYMSGGAVAVTDQSNGYTQRVDSYGNAGVLPKSSTITSTRGSTLQSGTALLTGAYRITAVTVSGDSSTASDRVDFYDNTSATGTPILEASLGTASETINIILPPGGIDISTGLYVKSDEHGLFVSVAYQN